MAALQPLRLPPPPAKRQRTEAVAGVQHAPRQPAPAPQAAGEQAFDEEAEWDAPGALPSDALAGLMLLLNSRFPAEARTAPFATRAQLYTVVTNRTEADRQLDALRRANAVRLLQLPAGRDEAAIMLTAHYTAALAASKARLLQQAGGGGGGDAGGSGAAAPSLTPAAAAAAAVFDWMAERVLPGCTAPMITHGELLALLAGGARAGPSAGAAGALPASRASVAPGAAPSGGGGGGQRRGGAGGSSAVSDAHVSLLLAEGYLTRHTGPLGADGYLFSMPNAGAAVRSVAAGRAEIVSLLRRRRQPEMLESELLKRKLQRSVLGVRWHIVDMLGAGALLRIDTAVGPLLRLAARGG